MSIPSINIIFSAAAEKTAARLNRGTAAVILKDAAAELNGKLIKLASEADIPSALSAENKAYVGRTFLGGENRPRYVYIAVIEEGAEDLSAALKLLASCDWDWLAAPPDCDEEHASEIVEWLKERRAEGAVYKAVLPEHAADCEAVVNFSASDILPGTEAAKGASASKLTAAQYASRIAGLACGTPLSGSLTYAPLTDLADIKRLTSAEMKSAAGAGRLVLIHDGTKVKVLQGVTSLTSPGTLPELKKVKLVSVMDAVKHDLRVLIQDEYIGKKPNSYDNKCLLATAIRSYFTGLERDGVFVEGSTNVGIDLEAQRAYLIESGVDVTDMSDDDIRKANTGTHVFILCSASVYDAIENIDVNISFDFGG